MKTPKETTQETKKSTIQKVQKEQSTGGEATIKDNRSKSVFQRKLQAGMHNAGNNPILQRKTNNTGLPDNLKSGIENLSGYSMDDVKVHYNSSKPAQLQAHAYAQGTDIHLAPNQEKHLPHEAWHIVQQKQGRVKPTKQLKSKVNINDDAGLEKEADVMGEISEQEANCNKKKAITKSFVESTSIVQRSVKSSGAKDGDFVKSENDAYMIQVGNEEILYSNTKAPNPQPNSLYTKNTEIVNDEEVYEWKPNIRLMNVENINESHSYMYNLKESEINNENEHLKKVEAELKNYEKEIIELMNENKDDSIGLILKNSCLVLAETLKFFIEIEHSDDNTIKQPDGSLTNTLYISEWMEKNGVKELSEFMKIGTTINQHFGEVSEVRLPNQVRKIGSHVMTVIGQDGNTQVILEANAAYDWERPKFDFIDDVDDLFKKTATPEEKIKKEEVKEDIAPKVEKPIKKRIIKLNFLENFRKKFKKTKSTNELDDKIYGETLDIKTPNFTDNKSIRAKKIEQSELLLQGNIKAFIAYLKNNSLAYGSKREHNKKE